MTCSAAKVDGSWTTSLSHVSGLCAPSGSVYSACTCHGWQMCSRITPRLSGIGSSTSEPCTTSARSTASNEASTPPSVYASCSSCQLAPMPSARNRRTTGRAYLPVSSATYRLTNGIALSGRSVFGYSARSAVCTGVKSPSASACKSRLCCRHSFSRKTDKSPKIMGTPTPSVAMPPSLASGQKCARCGLLPPTCAPSGRSRAGDLPPCRSGWRTDVTTSMRSASQMWS